MGEGAVGRMCQPISPGSPVVTPSILLIDRPFPPLPAGIVAGLAGSAPGVWDDTLHAWALNAIFLNIYIYNNENRFEPLSQVHNT